ncbi:uncharacterized protein LOC101863645 [Aplysia californica]|uniref:Uncharacterized protein LOC101863645 n=1 Tax=Aplysia californica TaxID=6500 RepID=A0ABM1AEV3_APLCA|nr:uncharacterized protein LOC101863645 [Aplysia californica]XP_012946340.1 uncharacterized protein LOC101863645 [Aplysia californica]XP_012946343.1 uncharacterized protein LOC101863645 [Aplysia californica]XP_035829585.1 uncharacterized protein LOC101863645 [Aplysia californica]
MAEKTEFTSLLTATRHDRVTNISEESSSSSCEENSVLYSINSCVERCVTSEEEEEKEEDDEDDWDFVDERDVAYLTFSSESAGSRIRRVKWSSMCPLWFCGLGRSCFCRGRSGPRWRRCSCKCIEKKGVQFLRRARDGMLDRLLVVQGALCALCVLLASFTFFPLGAVTADFENNCLLYAKLKIIHLSKENDTIMLDIQRTVFGDMDDCEYTTYINVAVAISSTIFIWFFVHNRAVKGQFKSQVKLLVPFFLFNFAFFICVLVSSSRIAAGNSSWCSFLEDNNKYLRKRVPCKEYQNHPWIPSTVSNFYTYSKMGEISSWLLTVALAVQCCITALHIYRDAKSHLGLVETSEKQPGDDSLGYVEEGQGIVNKGAEGISQEDLLEEGEDAEKTDSAEQSQPDGESLIAVDVHTDSATEESFRT